MKIFGFYYKTSNSIICMLQSKCHSIGSGAWSSIQFSLFFFFGKEEYNVKLAKRQSIKAKPFRSTGGLV